MILTNGKFTNAIFSSSKKDLIRAIWYDENLKTYQEISIKTDLNDNMYKKLLETFTTDEISTMTDQKHKNQAASFELVVKDIAKKYGLIYDPAVSNPQDKLTIDHLFTPTNDSVGTDLLFNLKVKIFDLPQVSSSTNSELKKRLRETKTPLEALYVAGKFLYE